MKIRSQKEVMAKCTDDEWYQSSIDFDGTLMNLVSTQKAIFDPMNTKHHICFADPKRPELTELICLMRNHYSQMLELCDAVKTIQDEHFMGDLYVQVTQQAFTELLYKLEAIEKVVGQR